MQDFAALDCNPLRNTARVRCGNKLRVQPPTLHEALAIAPVLRI